MEVIDSESEREPTSPSIHRIPVELLEDIFARLTLVDAIGELEVYADDSETDMGTDFDAETEGSDRSDVDVHWDGTSDTDSTYSYVSRPDLPLRLSWGWARVTHVCRLWRAIALALPSLWTNIPIHLPSQWLDELMRRTGEESLDVVSTKGTDLHDFDRIVLLLKSSISTVDYDISEDQWWGPAESLVAQTFPAGTEMAAYRASSSSTRAEQFQEAFEIDLATPDFSLLLTASRAEISSALNLTSSHFTANLTELRLTNVPHSVHENRLFTFNEFTTFVSRMPRMKSLYLSNCLPVVVAPEDLSAFESELALVELPHLQRLTLIEENNSEAVSPFISCVSFSNRVLVDVACLVLVCDTDDSPTHGPDTEPIRLNLDSLSLQRQSESQIRTLAIVQGVEGCDLHGWRDTGSRADGWPEFRLSDALIQNMFEGLMAEHSSNHGDVAIQYRYDAYTVPRQRWTLFNQPAVVFANLRVLSLSLRAAPCEALDSLHGGILALLYAARGVEHMRISAYSPDPKHSTAAAVLPALCQLDESRPSTSLPRWKLMPALQTLTIQNINPHTPTALGATILDAVRQVIYVRTVGAGSKLHTVYINNWMLHDYDALWRKGLTGVGIYVVYDTTMR